MVALTPGNTEPFLFKWDGIFGEIAKDQKCCTVISGRAGNKIRLRFFSAC